MLVSIVPMVPAKRWKVFFEPRDLAFFCYQHLYEIVVVCARLSSALYCLLWLDVIVEGRAGCACLGIDSTLDAFDVVVE